MSVLSNWLSLKAAPPPGVAVEIAGHQVAAAAVDVRGGRAAVVSHAVEPLPEGALAPSLTASNFRDRGAVAAALGRVLDVVGRPRRIGLVLPDPVAKVTLVRFEQVPPRTEDLEQLIRWQVRKSAPFPIDEAQTSFARGIRSEDGQEFVVTLARRDVVREYEDVCASVGTHAGLVDIATFNVVNAVLAAPRPPAGDWLLLNVSVDYASIAILRGPALIFFRTRSAEADETLADLVHQTAMYYEDRLSGAGFSRILLAGASAAGERHAADVQHLRRSLEARLGAAVETVDARAAAALTDRIASAPVLLDTLAPLVGLLVRGREAA
jgi:Tfp pilus assembly PilM family ATPase